MAKAKPRPGPNKELAYKRGGHKSRVVIYVEGGVVQDVWANIPNVSVELIDADNIEDEGFDLEHFVKVATKGLKPVWS
jgi:hypothetical protein